MHSLELVCFKMISNLGGARSAFMEAIQKAKNGEFDTARSLIEQGEELRQKGHDIHFELLTKESAGEEVPFALLLIHAEDQLMSVELLKVLAEEMIEVYQKILKN